MLRFRLPCVPGPAGIIHTTWEFSFPWTASQGNKHSFDGFFQEKNVQYGVSTLLIFLFLNRMVLRKPQWTRENSGSRLWASPVGTPGLIRMEGVLAASYLCSLRSKPFLSISPIITFSPKKLADKPSPVNRHVAHWDQNWKLWKTLHHELNMPKTEWLVSNLSKTILPLNFFMSVNGTTNHLIT